MLDWCEHSHEPLGSIKGDELLDHLGEYINFLGRILLHGVHIIEVTLNRQLLLFYDFIHQPSEY